MGGPDNSLSGWRSHKRRCEIVCIVLSSLRDRDNKLSRPSDSSSRSIPMYAYNYFHRYRSRDEFVFPRSIVKTLSLVTILCSVSKGCLTDLQNVIATKMGTPARINGKP